MDKLILQQISTYLFPENLHSCVFVCKYWSLVFGPIYKDNSKCIVILKFDEFEQILQYINNGYWKFAGQLSMRIIYEKCGIFTMLSNYSTDTLQVSFSYATRKYITYTRGRKYIEHILLPMFERNHFTKVKDIKYLNL